MSRSVVLVVAAAALLAGGLLMVLGLDMLGAKNQPSNDVVAGSPTTSPHSTDLYPRDLERCNDSRYASDIQIYSLMYLDCSMAMNVARNRALGLQLPGIAGPNTTPWDCKAAPYLSDGGPFIGLPSEGYVDCRGYRGGEFIRFDPGQPGP